MGPTPLLLVIINMSDRLICLSLLVLFLSACASTPMGNNTEQKLTPKQVITQIEKYQSETIHWGGTIVNTSNKKTTTEIEIIAYHLKDNGRPDLGSPPLGRFIAIQEGYLEVADYAADKQVSLTGTIIDIRKGKVGEADYTFPTVSTREIKLLSAETKLKPRFNFGFGLGSGGRSGIGIGIGF